MNVQYVPTAMTENREWHSYARLQRRWLLLARGHWFTLVIFTLGTFFASLPVYLALLCGIISQDNSVAIVISTLTIAALFQPLHRRLQNSIDRRFYRRKYDTAKIIEAFGATLRNEVDLSSLSGQLVAVVQETMQPAHVSLWLCTSEQTGKYKTLPTRANNSIHHRQSLLS